MVQPEGNYYVKLKSSNPLVKKLMSNFFKKLFTLLDKEQGCLPTNILDAGCGEGDFASRIHDKYRDVPMDAFDISEAVIGQAREEYAGQISFFTGDITGIPCDDSKYDLVTCSEVIEHIDEPKAALRELIRVTSRYILVTVPNEPLWRILNMCRFKYLKDFGNTPGHVNHFSKRKLLKLISEVGGVRVVGYTKAIPWQMVLLEKV